MNEDLTIEQMDSILLQYPHINRIEQDKEYTLPEIDYNLWSEERREKNKERLAGLERYLNLRYVVDDFENDIESRSEWLDTGNQKYNWFWSQVKNNNALPYTKLFTVYGTLYLLKSDYQGRNSEEFEHIISEAQNNIKITIPDYGKKSTEEKIQFVQKVKGELVKVISYLTEQKPASSVF